MRLLLAVRDWSSESWKLMAAHMQKKWSAPITGTPQRTMVIQQTKVLLTERYR